MPSYPKCPVKTLRIITIYCVSSPRAAFASPLLSITMSSNPLKSKLSVNIWVGCFVPRMTNEVHFVASKKNMTSQNMKPIYVLKILKYTFVYFGFFEELEIFPPPISRPTLLESEECLHFVKNPTIQQNRTHHLSNNKIVQFSLKQNSYPSPMPINSFWKGEFQSVVSFKAWGWRVERWKERRSWLRFWEALLEESRWDHDGGGGEQYWWW